MRANPCIWGSIWCDKFRGRNSVPGSRSPPRRDAEESQPRWSAMLKQIPPWRLERRAQASNIARCRGDPCGRPVLRTARPLIGSIKRVMPRSSPGSDRPRIRATTRVAPTSSLRRHQSIVIVFRDTAASPDWLKRAATPNYLKISRPGASPLDPRRKEVKNQGVSVLAKRKPMPPLRRPAVTLRRRAERRSPGTWPQPPPRTTRLLQSPVVQASPLAGAPL